jgi:hypothetical protein
VMMTARPSHPSQVMRALSDAGRPRSRRHGSD